MNREFNPEYLAYIKEFREHLVEVCRTETRKSDEPISLLEGIIILDKEEMEEIVEKGRKNKYAN